jgi:hypothetical protein
MNRRIVAGCTDIHEAPTEVAFQAFELTRFTIFSEAAPSYRIEVTH